MKRIKLEKAGSFAGRLLRLLGANRARSDPMNLQARAHVTSINPLFTNTPLKPEEAQLYWHDLRKAEALLHWQKCMDRPR